MNYRRILQILNTWKQDYPSLVVTLLWRIELYLILHDEIEASNGIMRYRAAVYDILIKKYEAEDLDGIQVFKKEYEYCMQTARRIYTPEEIAVIKEKKKKEEEILKQAYKAASEMNETMQVEEYGRESYTHIHNYLIEQLPGIKSLFDAKYGGKKYDESEDRSILEVLEILAYDEEKLALFAENTTFFMIDRNHIGYHEDMLKFRGVKGYDGKQHLCPFRTAYGMFYRGQKGYYSPCYSSLDRSLNDAQVFIERLKETAIKHLFRNHPTSSRFNEGTEYQLPNGKKDTFVFDIDYPALAQHYGVYTNLLDLTSDKIIAAFFACTGYNWEEDKYYPYAKQGHGVFYVYRDKNIFSKESRLSCVGLQPLSRPGAQAGYVLAMQPKEDFNQLCSEAITFTHHKEEAKQIYELVNLLGKPFVDDVMSEKAKEIVRGKTFGKEILEETIQSFYPSIEESTINAWIEASNIKISEDNPITFTNEEMDALSKEKTEVEKQLRTIVFNRIIMTMTVK